ncbi:hypothetical protein [Kribbella sp.]|uniref:hypothetical protein n=1 Tax=Kribbella sp. TaxID=1871183 RepID=UPI002D576F89|nr:hypothetical protein [Kribbella sp.]HZX07204.1 hypothetical protein [Kribbella sp.]
MSADARDWVLISPDGMQRLSLAQLVAITDPEATLGIELPSPNRLVRQLITAGLLTPVGVGVCELTQPFAVRSA